nr:MAG TPA: hypothetical protein [Caudoviricetes sp.]
MRGVVSCARLGSPPVKGWIGVGWETRHGPGEFLPPFFAPGPWCIILL